MKRFSRLIAFVLVVAMMVSLFANGQMPVFATGETEKIALDFIPEDAIAESVASGKTATINASPVKLYKSLDHGAEGIAVEVENGTEIELVTEYTFVTESENIVFYRYDYYGDNEELSNAAISEYSGYVFIYAGDITIKDESGSEGETGDDVTSTTLTDTMNNTGVSASGALPEGTTLSVTERTVELTGLNTNIYPVGVNNVVFDVSLLDANSATVQPESGITITFPKAIIPFATGVSYNIYHIHESEVEVQGPFIYDGNDVVATFAKLSDIVLAENEVLLDFVPNDDAYTVGDYYDTNLIATINNTTVNVYGGYVYGEVGVTATVPEKMEIELSQPITHSDGTILYRYEYYGSDTTFTEIARHYYFIHEDDITIADDDTDSDDNTYRPDISPVIPENPTLTEGADVSIVDEYGEAVTKGGFQLYEGVKTSLSAWSNLEGSAAVSYQWQICYDKDNDLWVDIYGQTGKGILISPAMVLSIIQEQGSTAIRCKVTSVETVQYSANIPVTVAQVGAQTPALLSLARANSVATLAETPELKNYSIVINYVFENNETAADTYTATLAAGSNFSATVAHPTVMGYLPYVDNDTETSTGINLNITNIQADVTYTVTYKPTNVDYTVIHYHQNLDNDNYTIAEIETLQGLTGTTVPEVANSYEGFYALLYEQPAIAADGSTVVEVYYDRYYYLMKFNLDGGYGTEPIYARYGTPVEIATPTKAGYTFQGWSPEAPSTVPVNGGTYTAQWGNAQTVTYTIVYWKENADDSNYSYWGQETKSAVAGTYVSGSDSIPASITTTTVDGENLNEKPYFIYNAAKTDTNVLVEGDSSTIVNVYYYRNTYTIYFTGISGTCAIEEHTHGTNCNSYLDCLKEEHTHDANCTKELTCTQSEHTHDTECTDLICTIPEHSEHTDTCLICEKPVHESHDANCCTIEAHTHGENCCTLDEHTHDVNCCTLSEHEHSIACIWGIACSIGYEHSHSDGTCSCETTAHTHGDGGCTCAQAEHVHGGSSCSCSIEIHYHSEDQGCYSDAIHQHNDNCYGLICGYAAHIHSDSCYKYTCGGEVHTHTDSCYRPCTKLEHTHDNSCTQNSDDNVIYVVTAKYEQTIGNVWPTAANFPDITFRGWKIDGQSATAVSKRINMTADLCDTSDKIKYAEAVEGGSKTYLYYMFESFDQNSPANGNERILRNGVYYDKSDLYYQEVNSGGDWNQKEIAGMAPVSNGVVESGDNVFLYYNRNRSNLSFHNVTGIVKTETGIMYQQSLVNYKDSDGNLLSAYVPAYPSTYEPNAYTFVGWYTSPECYDGTEFNFTTATMPNGDLTLYAKWEPVTHTVNYYLTKESLDRKETIPVEMARLVQEAIEDGTITTAPTTDPYTTVFEEDTVSHGGYITDVADPKVTEGYEKIHPRNGYTFVGWFYMEDGVEKAFDFANMPINKDLHVYAKWSSNVLKEYTVYFKIQGTDTVVADPITGSGLAGSTKTFNAKGGTELYAGYQEGYFPLVKSHSMTLSIEDESQNTFTFWYVQKDAVPYTVYYVTESQNAAGTLKEITLDGETYYIVADTYTNSENRKAVVTEKFKVVPGYMPDAYQKRLVVDGSDDADNKIIFNYTIDTKHAYYKITHYTQNTDGDNWTEYASSEAVGNIGDKYSADPLTIDGFTYDSTVEGTVVEGVLTADGLELKLYYVRNRYPYEVRYLEQGTGKELHEPKSGSGLYGEVVSENAIPIVGYTAVDPKSQALNIRIEESQDEAKLNIITFYYEELVDIKYIAVDRNYTQLKDTSIGSVALNPDGTITTETSESIAKHSGSAVGATAAVSDDEKDVYIFTGWYKETEDNKYELVSKDASYVPSKNGTYYEDAIYYARFIPIPVVSIEKLVTSNGEAVPAAELAGYQAKFELRDSQGNTVATATIIYDANGNAEPAQFTFVDGFDFTTAAKLEVIEIIPDDVYVYDQKCLSTTFAGKDETTVLVEDRYIELKVDGRNLAVVCTNNYPVESYISIEKALTFGNGISDTHKADIIEAYYNVDQPVQVSFKLTTKADPSNILATAKTYADANGEFTPAKFIDMKTGRTFIPTPGETYVITETSNHAITGYFWTHDAVEVTVDTVIEEISYSNNYEIPSVTITKKVISKDTDGNAVTDEELNKLIQKYAGGTYQATFVLTDYATSNVAGKLVITFHDGYDSDSTTNRTGTVYLNDDYLKTLIANSDIKLVINEDHTNGATTILGSEYPGVSFSGEGSYSDKKYVITLTAENPNAEIVCVNEYPPASYISVQKELDLTNVAIDKQDEVYAYYESNPNVQFALYKNYGAEGAVVVAYATSIFDSDTKTFSKATFVAGEYGNAFEPEVGVAYTIVETSTHRLGGYVWEKIGASGSETILVSADNPVSENTYTNKYTTAEVGLEIEKTLVFNDESGNALSTDDIKEVLNGISGDVKNYTATFGIWEATSDYQTQTKKIAEATVTIGLTDFSTGNTAAKVAEITPYGDVTDLNAYLKEKGQSETETYLLIIEESATEISSNKLDVDYGIVNGVFNASYDQYIVLGGAGTENQIYSHEVKCRNTYPPTNLRTSLRIVKEEAVPGTIKDGEQFSFIVQTQIAGENVEREVVIVWDSSKEENSVTITDIPLKTTVVVESGWGWRYVPDENVKQKLLSVVESDNVITFTNTLGNEQWLDDQVIAENNFTAVSTTETTN